VSFVLFMLLAFKLKLHVGFAYLISVNISTFLLYGYDKLTSKFSFLRVPEFVLHLFCALGGTPMAFISQKLFSHKTSKESFQQVFKIIALVHLILLTIAVATVIYFA